MLSNISSRELHISYPHLPLSFKTYIPNSASISTMGGVQNAVFLIDNRYILRTRKIKLNPYDDIGSCGNFKKVVDHISKHHFIYHPNNLVLESSKGPGEDTVEFLLYRLSPGKSLNNLLPVLSRADIIRIAKLTAKIMCQLHQIDAPNYGFFKGQSFNSWNDFIDYWIKNQSLYIQKNKILTDEEITKVRRIFKKYRNLLTLDRPVTIHFDFNSSNILIDHQGKINCIIDWDNARGGDPIIDVSYTLERANKIKGSDIFCRSFFEEYMRQTAVKNKPEFMLKYRLYSLFYAYKLLPVHATHTSNQYENVKNLSQYVRKILTLPL